MRPRSESPARSRTDLLRAGDWVQVKSVEEILATLDEDAALDALPFMPEMLQYCGQRFRVFKSAHKTCNTLGAGGIRRMANAVHLAGLRCDGQAHGGCQAGCLLFWKEAWLKRVHGPEGHEAQADPPAPIHVTDGRAQGNCAPETLTRATRALAAEDPAAVERYRCQATELGRATAPGQWWDPRLYLQDLASRNVRLWDVVRYGLLAAFNLVMRQHRLLRRFSCPSLHGLAGHKTPEEVLNLQPGDWVQVRSKDEIMRSLNDKNRNRGLLFDVEMLPYCGARVRVLRRATRFIDDRTGVMTMPPNPCLILEGVTCGGRLSSGRLFCPRSIYPYWHETWLKRVERKEQFHAARIDAAQK
jgi:hypothetical protein